jgi:hypothetical protein
VLLAQSRSRGVEQAVVIGCSDLVEHEPLDIGAEVDQTETLDWVGDSLFISKRFANGGRVPSAEEGIKDKSLVIRQPDRPVDGTSLRA